jgi:hypothetical protein
MITPNAHGLTSASVAVASLAGTESVTVSRKKHYNDV